jgi:hypothetical protein
LHKGDCLIYNIDMPLSLLRDLGFVEEALGGLTPTGLGDPFFGEVRAHLVVDQLRRAMGDGEVGEKIRSRFTQTQQMARELRIFHAMRYPWSGSTSPGGGYNFRFYERKQYSKGLTWGGHDGSIPKVILGVRLVESNGYEVELPANIGYRLCSAPSRRFGFVNEMRGEHAILRKDGNEPQVYVVSGYAHKHGDPLLEALNRNDLRTQMEVALNKMMLYAGLDLGLSAILFHVRADPAFAINLGLDKFKKLQPFVMPPRRGTFSEEEREIVQAILKSGKKFNAADHPVNAATWIAIPNLQTIDLNTLPRIDSLRAFAWDANGGVPRDLDSKSQGVLRERIERITHSSCGGPIGEAIRRGEAKWLDPRSLVPSRLGAREVQDGRPNLQLLAEVPDEDHSRVLRLGEKLQLLNERATELVAEGKIGRLGKKSLMVTPDQKVKLALLDGEALDLGMLGSERVGGKVYRLGYRKEEGRFCYRSKDGMDVSQTGLSHQWGVLPKELYDPSIRFYSHLPDSMTEILGAKWNLLEAAVYYGRLDATPEEAVGVNMADSENPGARERLEYLARQSGHLEQWRDWKKNWEKMQRVAEDPVVSEEVMCVGPDL